ncbi:MAG TPA: cytochrome c oxidase assembly protein [Solirubrobacteraceae bacterium]|nr:cytochrome c oxidase assembly protein [Solirubrobacteraceae bacterium]
MTLPGFDTTPLPLATSTDLEAVFQIGPLVIAGLLYARRVRTLAFEGRNPVPGWRQACFYSGFVVIAAALTSLGRISQELLFMHMIEHLLLGDVAALLIVLGLTGPLIAPILRIRFFDRLRVLANPLIAFPLWAINLYAWHLPSLYEAALRHAGVHALEHAAFLGFGINMWMCLFGPLPMPSWFGNLGKLIYIVAVRLAGTVLGNIFLWSGTVFYPYYIKGDISYHISPIADQNIAGAVMMVEESLLTIGLFCWLFMRAARESEERQELLDYAQAHGIELTDKRAARAVSAGRGAELRERLEALAGGGARRTATRQPDADPELEPQGQRTDHSASERQLS